MILFDYVDIFSSSMMDLPVVSTFVHFGNVSHGARSKSAPPSVWRNVRRSEKHQWPSKRILRRWYCFTERVLERHYETVKVLTTHESRRAWLEPKLRLHLPKAAYDVFLHIFEDKSIVEKPLEDLGVIRDVGDNTVQFWASDACLKTEAMMQAMLNEAQNCRDTYEANEIRVAMHYSRPLKMKLTDRLTFQSLRRRVEKHFQIRGHRQILTHKGQQLFRGTLSEQGVARGSVIIVSERGWLR